MPEEKDLVIYAKNVLMRAGYYPWDSVRSEDIYGVFDIICFKGGHHRFIQLTTYPNHAARRRKVEKFIKDKNFRGQAEVWSWKDDVKRFRMEIIK